MITIKTVTHCPTCGAECRVEGTETHYYVPVLQERTAKLEAENQRLKGECAHYKKRYGQAFSNALHIASQRDALRDALEAILKINWGYDGDCGAVRIADCVFTEA